MYWIVTDSGTDLPKSYIDAQEHFICVPITITMDGKVIVPDGSDEAARETYNSLRAGKVITTSQINSMGWKETLEPILRQGDDLLCIPFSSGLSGTAQAAALAAEELRRSYPDRKLIVVDSLAASMGHGGLVWYAVKNRAEGMELDANAQWLRDHLQQMHHWFTVDDLMFLKRGGRVSATSAVLGTMIKIKPVMDVDEHGKLIVRDKVQGRKRSLRRLMEEMQKHAVKPEEQTVFISHADCPEEAGHLAQEIRDHLHVKDVLISYIGPVIGSHTGPGCIALFFMGDQRV